MAELKLPPPGKIDVAVKGNRVCGVVSGDGHCIDEEEKRI
jgi:hypothetical protein